MKKKMGCLPIRANHSIHTIFQQFSRPSSAAITIHVWQHPNKQLRFSFRTSAFRFVSLLDIISQNLFNSQQRLNTSTHQILNKTCPLSQFVEIVNSQLNCSLNSSSLELNRNRKQDKQTIIEQCKQYVLLHTINLVRVLSD